ncbi:MAG: glycosyltransferase [Acidobacteriota bacterium]
MARPHVLLVGLGGYATGFGRVLHELIRELGATFTVDHLAIDEAEAADWLAPRALSERVDRDRPHVVLMVHEPWAWRFWRPALERCDHRPKWLFYAAIDRHQAIDAKLATELGHLDALIVYNQFGQDAAASSASVALPPVHRIPHGVDVETFRPLAVAEDGTPDRQASRLCARRDLFPRLFPDHGDTLDDAFVILNANRNQPNKRIDLTCEAFAGVLTRLEPDEPRPWLYLHMSSRRRRDDEAALVDRLGIRDRVLATTRGEHHPELDDDDLCRLYNACDVGLNTSEGEGWGLIAFEHGAVGAPQVLPRHSACAELWEGHARLVDTATEDTLEGYRRRGQTVDVDVVAEALLELYRDRSLRDRLGHLAFTNAHRPEYRWRHIADRWRRLIESIL